MGTLDADITGWGGLYVTPAVLISHWAVSHMAAVDTSCLLGCETSLHMFTIEGRRPMFFTWKYLHLSDFKTLLFVFKASHGPARWYVSELLNTRSPQSRLRGKGVFATAAPKLWNIPPLSINALLLSSFLNLSLRTPCSLRLLSVLCLTYNFCVHIWHVSRLLFAFTLFYLILLFYSTLVGFKCAF